MGAKLVVLVEAVTAIVIVIVGWALVPAQEWVLPGLVRVNVVEFGMERSRSLLLAESAGQ